MIYFVTGNKFKFAEAKEIIPELQQLVFDVHEIQELDPKKIIEHKVKDVARMHSGDLVAEDVSLYLDALNGFPGPLIKWVEKSIKMSQLADIVQKQVNTKATVEVLLGYAKNGEVVKFFSGRVEGDIVAPRGNEEFGFDCIFQPKGHNKTYGEMTQAEKKAISHRAIAFRKIKEFLQK